MLVCSLNEICTWIQYCYASGKTRAKNWPSEDAPSTFVADMLGCDLPLSELQETVFTRIFKACKQEIAPYREHANFTQSP